MADLCNSSHVESEAAFVTSSAAIGKPPGLPDICPEVSHADPSTSSGGSPSGFGGDPDLFAHPPHDDLQYDNGNSAGGACERDRCGPDQPVDHRSQVSEGEDFGAREHHHQPAGAADQPIHGTTPNEPYQLPVMLGRICGSWQRWRKKKEAWVCSQQMPPNKGCKFLDWPKHFPTYGVCDPTSQIKQSKVTKIAGIPSGTVQPVQAVVANPSASAATIKMHWL